MTVIGFSIINPVSNSKKPFYSSKDGTFYFPVTKRYRYYVEVKNITETGAEEYYLLVSDKNFDENCRRCSVDNYGRCKFKPKGELLNYIKEECKERGNIICEYSNTIQIDDCYSYDIFRIL